MSQKLLFQQDENATVLELICLSIEKSLHTPRRLIKENLFNDSRHQSLANAQRGASQTDSTFAVVLKCPLGLGSRLHFEQLK